MSAAGLLPNSEPEHLEWKYWQSRCDWPGPRSYVLARGHEILAHAAIIPGACLSVAHANQVRRVRTINVIDWAALPKASGAGVSLMKHIGQATDAVVSVGGSAQTLQLLPHLGFQSLGVATCYVRPLHPMRILCPSTHPTCRVLPRLARSLLWQLRAPAVEIDGWSARRIEFCELRSLMPLFPAPTPGMQVFERSEAMFRYALACPIASMHLYAVERAGHVRGYFLLAFALRQARLADLWMSSDNPDDWRALIECAALQAKRHPLAAELAAWGSDPELSKRLQECGFHARGDLQVQMLKPRYPYLKSAQVRVQMLDNDAAYRHCGRNEFWA